jgi:hypothetical protein
MEGEFRPIEGYPGYRVSSTGEVQSCWSRHARPSRMTETWLPLRVVRRRWGHLTVNLSRDGKKTSRSVHRLVLESWVGPCPPGLICCHNDGDPSNNSVGNLRWDSHQSNADDTLRHGTRAMGSRCRASKLREQDVLEIRRLRAEGFPTGELASRFGVTYENILAIVSRRSWRHLPGGHNDEGNGGLTHFEGPGHRPGAAIVVVERSADPP